MNSERPRLQAISVGTDAARALAAGGTGEVIAVFRRSLYLRLDGGLACIGEPGIGDGPLNIPCHAVPDDLRAVTAMGQAARIAPHAITLPRLAIATRTPAPWSPPATPDTTPEKIVAGLGALAAALPATMPAGLGAFIRPRPALIDLVETSAASAVAELSEWIRCANGPSGPDSTHPTRAVRTLLGLGPGLTPAGDDFLAGVVVALRALGDFARARWLAREIVARAPFLTNEISRAHLAAAAEGRLRADLHAAMNTILLGDAGKVRETLRPLTASASGSPWDALAGMTTAFRSAVVSFGHPCWISDPGASAVI